MWLSVVLCFSCSGVDFAAQQPEQGEIRYWSEGLHAEVIDLAAERMGVMGWQFTRVATRSQADITVEMEDCSNPEMIGHSNPCGEILFCRGHDQRPAFFLHEFGHALGAPHIEGGPAVMNAHSEEHYFTPLDVEAFERGGYGLSIFNCE